MTVQFSIICCVCVCWCVLYFFSTVTGIYLWHYCSIVSVQRPINLNVSPHSWFMPNKNSRTHIYPMHIPIAKTTTIKENAAPDYKNVPNFTTKTSTSTSTSSNTINKYVLPYHASNKGIVQYKKSPFLIHFPTLKSVVFHRTN